MAVSTSTLMLVINATNLTGPAFTGVQRSLLGLGLAGGTAAVAVGVAAVKMTANYQQAVLKIQALTGQTAASTQKLSTAMLAMSTKVPFNPTTLANAMYLISSAGYSGADAMNILNISAKAAAVGGMSDVAPVANILTSSLRSYGAGANQAQKYQDILTETVVRGKMQMADLTAALATVLPAAASAGVSLQQVGAAVATMSMHGVPAQLATTQLARLIQSITAPKKGQMDVASMLGLDLSASNLKKSGLQGMIDQIYAATGGNQKLLSALLPDIRAYRAELQLTGPSATQYATNLKIIGTASNGAGITQSAFNTTMQGLNQTLNQIGSTISSTTISLVYGMLPGISSLALDVSSGLVPAMGALQQVFMAIGAVWQAVQGPLSVLAVILGSAALQAGVMVSAFFNMLGAILSLLPSLNGVSGALVTNHTLLVDVGTILGIVVGIWASLRIISLAVALAQAVLAIATAAVNGALGLQVIGALALATAAGIVRGAILLWAGVQVLLNLAVAAFPIIAIILAIGALVAGVIWAYNNVTWFHNLVLTLWTTLRDKLGTVLFWLVLPFSATTAAVIWLFTNMTSFHNLILTIWQTLLSLFGPALATIADVLRNVLGGAIGWVSDKLGGLMGNIQGAINAVQKLPGIGSSPTTKNTGTSLVGFGIPSAASIAATVKKQQDAVAAASSGSGGVPGLTAAQQAALNKLSGQNSVKAANDQLAVLKAQFAADKQGGMSAAGLQAQVNKILSFEKANNVGNAAKDAIALNAQITHMQAVKTNTDASKNLTAQIQLLTQQYKTTGNPALLAQINALDKQKLIKSGVDPALAAKLATSDTSKLAEAATKVVRTTILAPALSLAQQPGWGNAIVSIGAVQQASAAEELRQLRAQNTALQQQVANDSRQITLLTQQNRTLAQIADHSSDTATHTKRTADVMTHPARSTSGTLRNLSAMVVGR